VGQKLKRLLPEAFLGLWDRHTTLNLPAHVGAIRRYAERPFSVSSSTVLNLLPDFRLSVTFVLG
jgi:hypothetical protein